MHRDRLGRTRQPNQSRGLRPLHPLLPSHHESRALRVAMEAAHWARFEALVRGVANEAPTRARAYGETISRLMDRADAAETPLGWLDWERRKTLRLLGSN